MRFLPKSILYWLKKITHDKFYHISCGLGTIIIAISGLYLSSHISITKDKEVEVIQAVLQDKRTLFTETANLLHARLFDFNRLYWVVNDIKSAKDINENFIMKMREKENIYYETTRYFNINMHKISYQLKYVFNPEIAYRFSVRNDNERSPKGIVGKFIKLHNHMRDVIICIYDRKIINYSNSIYDIYLQKEDLRANVENFLDDMSRITFKKSYILNDVMDSM